MKKSYLVVLLGVISSMIVIGAMISGVSYRDKLKEFYTRHK